MENNLCSVCNFIPNLVIDHRKCETICSECGTLLFTNKNKENSVGSCDDQNISDGDAYMSATSTTSPVIQDSYEMANKYSRNLSDADNDNDNDGDAYLSATATTPTSHDPKDMMNNDSGNLSAGDAYLSAITTTFTISGNSHEMRNTYSGKLSDTNDDDDGGAYLFGTAIASTS